MCIKNDDYMVVKNGQLKLWKVIRQDNIIGIWGETERNNKSQKTFKIGKNLSSAYYDDNCGMDCRGQFHCFFTREDARSYHRRHQKRARQVSSGTDPMWHTKIIQVFADSDSVVSVGQDRETNIDAISVSKMEIKSLKHQR